jgi:CDP-4-dehydro-6-deoxyglucose reductase
MNISTVEGKCFESVECKSILESALDSGLIFEHSCKTGLCGVCKTSLLDGQVKITQEQTALTAKETGENKILTCCCEAETDILIDAMDLEMFQGIERKVVPARINAITKLSDDIVEVVLRLPPNAKFTFLEGQFIDVMWNGIKRSYSIANSSCQKEISLYIKRVEQGMMSDYWFNQAKDNDLLRIEGPQGTFVMRDANKPIIFLATGTGIAPIKSILDKIDSEAKFSQPIYLFWGNRSTDDFIWQGEFTNISVIQKNVLSKPDENWNGHFGYVQDLVPQTVVEDIEKCQVYACGSYEMIQAAKDKMISLGLDETQFYSDAFVQSN